MIGIPGQQQGEYILYLGTLQRSGLSFRGDTTRAKRLKSAQNVDIYIIYVYKGYSCPSRAGFLSSSRVAAPLNILFQGVNFLPAYKGPLIS